MPDVIFSGKDFGGERSSFTVPLGSTVVSGANYDAFVNAISNLLTNIAPLTYMPLHETFKAIADPVDDQASNEEGQREKKWRVRYTSTVTGKSYAMEIPGAILTGHLVAGTDRLDISAGDGAAFVTAFELDAREPETDNAVTVDYVQFVGRTL